MTLVLVIPAHNEEAQILETLASVTAQTVQPDRTIVLCDNCTDNTAMLAAQAGFEVWHSIDNAGKKGGALNQAYERLAGDLEVGDYFATMDADTILDSHFIARALEKFDELEKELEKVRKQITDREAALQKLKDDFTAYLSSARAE